VAVGDRRRGRAAEEGEGGRGGRCGGGGHALGPGVWGGDSEGYRGGCPPERT